MSIKKGSILIVLLVSLSLPFSGCGNAIPAGASASASPSAVVPSGSASGNHDSSPTDEALPAQGLKVVTTLFPQYDFVRILAGDRAEVTLILPPGIEPHSFEPTPRNIVEIGQADLFIYTGNRMEPWAGRILEGIQSTSLQVVDASEGVDLLTGHDHDHNEEGAAAEDHGHEDDAHAAEDHGHEDDAHAVEDHDSEGADPHIWLDPLRAIQMVRNIENALVKADPEGESFYRENAEVYVRQLQAFDATCQEAFTKVNARTIVYGGHFAFGYFAQRYNLTHVSPYTGFSPDAEPTPRKIAELINQMKHSGATALFFEELVDPKVAEVIAASTGAEMLLLHGAHNVTREELENGATYLGIMTENLERLKKGLGYHE